MGRHLERQDLESLARQAGHRADVIAHLVGVSLRQLERQFRRRFRCTPHQWLVESRLRHAAELLLEMKSNKEVAAAVGLAGDSALCHFFREHAACTPQQYVADNMPPVPKPQSQGSPRSDSKDSFRFDI